MQLLDTCTIIQNVEVMLIIREYAWEQKNGDEGGKDIMKKHRRQVLYSGIVTAIGMKYEAPFWNGLTHHLHRGWNYSKRISDDLWIENLSLLIDTALFMCIF